MRQLSSILPFSSDDRSFWPAFQKRWAALLCEQTAGLRPWSEAMARALGRGIIEVPNSAEAHSALALLNTRLARLESVRVLAQATSPAQDGVVPSVDSASCAHFVRYGAAILSVPGPDSDLCELDYGQMRLHVDDLCEWLKLLKLVPRRVFGLENFDAQIVGRAIARQLEIEFEVTNGDGYTHSRSLIVGADSRLLTAPPLRTIFPAQVLYALNLHRETGAIAPDVASLARATLVLPWHDERPSARKINGIVERIIETSPCDSPPDWPARLEFYRTRRTLLSAGSSAFTRLPMLPEIN